MSKIYVAMATHPDQRRPVLVDLDYKRQRVSTIYRQLAPADSEIEMAVWLNGEDITDKDLRRIRVKPGDKLAISPRVGFWAFMWTAASWLFSNVVVPVGISYGISYAAGEIFGQDLPDSDNDYHGQSYGFSPRTRQGEGGVQPWAFGENMHHGTILARWTDVDATGNTGELLYMLVGFGEGPTEGIVSGEIFLNNRPVSDYAGVTTEERMGTWDQTCMTDFTKTKIEMRLDSGGRVTNTGGPLTFTLPRSGFDDIEYTLYYGHGLWIQSKTGHVKAGELQATVEIAEVGTESWTTLYNAVVGTPTQKTPVFVNHKASVESFTCDRTKQYKLKVTKVSTDNNVRRSDHIALRSVRGVVDIAFRHPGEAMLGIKAVGTEQLQGDIDVKVRREDRICWKYNGSSWELGYSTNRAWGLYNELVQPCILGDGGGTAYSVDHVEGFTQAQLDTAFFYEWSQMCDDLVDDGKGSTEELMPLHHIFDQARTVWDHAYECAQIGRAHLVWQGTLLTGWIDKAVASTTDLATAENIVAGSWREEWTKQNKLAGTIIVNYQDESLDFKRIPWPVHNSAAGRYQNTISVEATGLKTRGQATRVGWFALKRNELIRTSYTFRMHTDATGFQVGSVMPTQYNRPNWGTSYRVRRFISNTWLLLDRTVVAAAGDTLYVRSYNPGTEQTETKEYTVKSISGAKVQINETFTIQPVPDNIVAIGSTSQIVDVRIKSIEWLPDHQFKIVGDEYNASLYSVDSGTPTVPYSGTTLPAVHNRLGTYPTWAEMAEFVAQQIPSALDVDMPIMSNITWNDDTPSAGSVSWSATTAGEDLEINYKGTLYAITAGNNTDDYIYWAPGSSTFSSTNTPSTMQTRLLAGDFMVCLNVSGTAHPAQGFPLLWAGLLQAGSITASLGIIANAAIGTAQIIDANITAAKIGALAVEEAKIKNLNVTTIKIADDATKITNSAQGSNTSTSSASWTTVCTVSISSDGGTVNIMAQAQISNVDVGADQRVRVYNTTNSTTVFEQEYSPAAPSLFMAQACVEIPGSGTRTYYIQMKSDGSASFTLSSIVLSLLESKGK